jgi:hypothetical protein
MGGLKHPAGGLRGDAPIATPQAAVWHIHIDLDGTCPPVFDNAFR